MSDTLEQDRPRPGRKSKVTLDTERAERERLFNEAVASKVAEILPDAVAEKIKAMVPELAEELAKVRQAAGVDPVAKASDQALLEGLAHAMAKASDPGNKRRILPPEVMKQREEATQRMRRYIIEFHAQARMPHYRVLAKTFLAETLIDPQYRGDDKEMHDQEIDWAGVPNQALDPINEEAKAIHAEFLLSIGMIPRDIANDPAPWVISGGLIVRGKPGHLRAQNGAQGAVNADPRTYGGKAKAKTIKVLGSIADPAVVGP